MTSFDQPELERGDKTWLLPGRERPEQPIFGNPVQGVEDPWANEREAELPSQRNDRLRRERSSYAFHQSENGFEDWLRNGAQDTPTRRPSPQRPPIHPSARAT